MVDLQARWDRPSRLLVVDAVCKSTSAPSIRNKCVALRIPSTKPNPALARVPEPELRIANRPTTVVPSEVPKQFSLTRPLRASLDLARAVWAPQPQPQQPSGISVHPEPLVGGVCIAPYGGDTARKYVHALALVHGLIARKPSVLGCGGPPAQIGEKSSRNPRSKLSRVRKRACLTLGAPLGSRWGRDGDVNARHQRLPAAPSGRDPRGRRKRACALERERWLNNSSPVARPRGFEPLTFGSVACQGRSSGCAGALY